MATPIRSTDHAFCEQIEEQRPFLLAFAKSLCRGREEADDLVQETLLKAWQARNSFTPGTNMKAWLCTILRNQHISYRRRAWRQAAWDQESAEAIPDAGDAHYWCVSLAEAQRALNLLPEYERQAILLVGANGYSHATAAEIVRCSERAMKKRYLRAKQSLRRIMEGETPRGHTAGRKLCNRAAALEPELAGLVALRTDRANVDRRRSPATRSVHAERSASILQASALR